MNFSYRHMLRERWPQKTRGKPNYRAYVRRLPQVDGTPAAPTRYRWAHQIGFPLASKSQRQQIFHFHPHSRPTLAFYWSNQLHNHMPSQRHALPTDIAYHGFPHPASQTNHPPPNIRWAALATVPCHSDTCHTTFNQINRANNYPHTDHAHDYRRPKCRPQGTHLAKANEG